MKIDLCNQADEEKLVVIWEAAVRASYDFLSESGIQFFKGQLRPSYFPAVLLKCVKNQSGEMLGFIGTQAQNIEMLFVHPNHWGKGIGKALLDHAIHAEKAKHVDVNEQNPIALRFYKHYGFEIQGRSEVDAMGKPFPILHMVLTLKSQQS